MSRFFCETWDAAESRLLSPHNIHSSTSTAFLTKILRTLYSILTPWNIQSFKRGEVRAWVKKPIQRG